MDCFYCEQGEKLAELMVPVCELSASNVYLVRNQNFPGRCVVALKEHKTELYQLEKEQLHAYSEEVAAVARAIGELFEADKLNYGIFGDGVPHMHYHIIPKRRGEYCWGGQFDMNGNPDYPPEEVLLERAGKLKTRILELVNG